MTTHTHQISVESTLMEHKVYIQNNWFPGVLMDNMHKHIYSFDKLYKVIVHGGCYINVTILKIWWNKTTGPFLTHSRQAFGLL